VSETSAVTHPRRRDARETPAGVPEPDLDRLVEVMGEVGSAVARVIEGKDDVVRIALTVLLAEGHLLVEDVPGVGKTTLAKAMARAVDGEVRRIQFTPDLLPSDVTGVSIWDAGRRVFEFTPGPVFANIVIGDEINRASPKTQSSLLECMEEQQVTVDGTTYPLASPFMVVATQNPVEMDGTFPLPEAQRDRFMARVSMGYPGHAAERAMLDHHGAADPLADLRPVTDAGSVHALALLTRTLHVADPLKDYVLDLVRASREHPALRLGASPRAALHLLRAARAGAAIAGREHVIPDDVQALARPVLAHRLMLGPEAQLEGRTGADLVEELLTRVPVHRAGVRPATAPGWIR